MHEIVINMHMHTRYSDGQGSHAEIAQAAIKAGIDGVIVTDHNVLVSGPEDYYGQGERKTLLMIGEEIHDQARQPQKNHLLAVGMERDLAPLAGDPQRLIQAVRQAGGVTFLAHPGDPAAPAFGETDITWVDWQVTGYHGLEIWNAMSEFKSYLKTPLHGLYYLFNPERVALAPCAEVMKRWDELLSAGQHVFAVGGTDAHALPVRLGPWQRALFPYEFHFRTINNHLFLPTPLTGNVADDKKMTVQALGRGRGFIGYDLPASTRGFRFSAQAKNGPAQMGDEVSAQGGVTFQIRLPRPAECRLIKDGRVLKTWGKQESCTHITNEPGVYRVECYLPFRGKLRGWIFSNPIFVIK